jgi:hypothetical protein
VADYRTVSLGNERDGKLSGLAQRIDNELFSVARMLGVQKRGNRYGLNRCNIGGGLTSDLDFHPGRPKLPKITP